MPVRISSSGVLGIEAHPIVVEVDVSSGAYGYETVGLPDIAVRESRQRVQTAIRNCGFDFPRERVVVNLTPAHLKKEGTVFDLPIAVGVIHASRKRPQLQLSDTCVVGELSLNGDVRPINGVLAIAIRARDDGMKRLLVPEDNASEAAAVPGVEVAPVASLSEAVSVLEGGPVRPAPPLAKHEVSGMPAVDLRFVRGQKTAKRAVEVAAAGGHNVLLTGLPGTGKSLLSRAMHGILPPLSIEEQIAVSRIYSVAGLLDGRGLVSKRPFRAPHSTATTAAIIGGGNGIPRPGEVSLAHCGVLFLDELPEFSRSVRESLRQPIESGCVTVARATHSVRYPAHFQLVATMNPCPCGYYGERGGDKRCRCDARAVARYQARISGPLRDRFDLNVRCPLVPRQLLLSDSVAEPSVVVQKRVELARQRQAERLSGTQYSCNAQVHGKDLEDLCRLDTPTRKLVSQAMDSAGLSARAFHRAARVARTIADLAGTEDVTRSHFAEALVFRSAVE